jgi:NADH-quinone oxidoreductase subunit I
VSDHGEHSTPGKGLVQGLAVTLKTMTQRSVTQQYPDIQPELPPRSRGVIALLEENCTVCMLCARECPDWCIYIDSHKEEVVVPGAARARQRNVLDKFDIDFSLCMYCGICIEVCPFDALHWTPEFEYAETDVLDLLHDKSRLGDWMRTVPPPPAHDVLGEPSKEEATAARKLAGPGKATAAKTGPRAANPSIRRNASPTADPAPTDPVAPAAAAPSGPASAPAIPQATVAPATPAADAAPGAAEGGRPVDGVPEPEK